MESNPGKHYKVKSRMEIIMKNKFMRTLALIGTCVLVVGSLAACGNDSTKSGVNAADIVNTVDTKDISKAEDTADGSDVTTLAGSLQMVGSTSMEKISNALSEAFMEKYTDVTVSAEFVGSSAGIEAVLSGSADIGNASRSLKEEEKVNAVENIVAIDGIAVCTDLTNTVTGLTKQQLLDIYTGVTTNWSDLGGADAPIVVVGRESGSGTRGAFEELLEAEDICVYANELDSTGAVMAKVASVPGAIGYVSLDAVDDSVITMELEGVEATPENIKAGNYFLSRPFVMATNGEISAQNEIVQAWFDFVFGEDGQQVVADLGLVTVK